MENQRRLANNINRYEAGHSGAPRKGAALLQGIAMAMFFTPLSLLALSGLSQSQMPAASGLINFFRIMCGGFGSSIATTAWDSRTSLHHARLSEHSGIYDPQFVQATAQLQQIGMTPAQSYGVIEHTLSIQASTLAIDDIFWFSAVLSLALIAFVWLTKPIHGEHATVDIGGH